MKFTKEEIALCRKIAEKYRKEVKYGDWIYSLYGKPGKMLYDKSLIENDYLNFIKEKNVIPFWQISDCLEFLREKGWFELNYSELQGKQCWVIRYQGKSQMDNMTVEKQIMGKAPLEACLKAVLAIMKEEL